MSALYDIGHTTRCFFGFSRSCDLWLPLNHICVASGLVGWLRDQRDRDSLIATDRPSLGWLGPCADKLTTN